MANKYGTVDFVVQSTDKNYMTPVGGAIVFSNNKKVMTEFAKFYPGRASSSPIIDLFCNLMAMGKNGLKKLIKERKEGWKFMKAGL